MGVEEEVKLGAEEVSYAHACDAAAHYADDADLLSYLIIHMIRHCQIRQWPYRYYPQLPLILLRTLYYKLRSIQILLNQLLLQLPLQLVLIPIETLLIAESIFREIEVFVHVTDHAVLAAF